MELDYPRDMSMWKGVPYNIDAVFQHTNGNFLSCSIQACPFHTILTLNGLMSIAGKTYFFQGKVFWEFDDRRMRVVNTTASLSAPFFMGCPRTVQNVEDDAANADPGDGRDQELNAVPFSSASAPRSSKLLWLVLIMSFPRVIQAIR